MLSTEQTTKTTARTNLLDSLAQQSLLKLFNKMTKGHLTIYENGVLLEDFGDPNDSLKADINILDPVFFRRFLFGGSIAAGETYIDGIWKTSNLTDVIRFFARNIHIIDAVEKQFSWLSRPAKLLTHWSNRNSKQQSKRNIAAHYDLGNSLYTEFLDDSMMYSSAIYPNEDASLAQAQQHKLKVICEKLQLTSSDRLVEIGSGWGSLAIFAAKHYGCHVTTTTISEEQFAWADAQIKQQNLSDRITLLKKDYRELTGQYDKLVSIEMIEAVGESYLKTFFETCNKLLKPNGLMLLQAITINDQRYASYSKDVDFIQKYIFPGGFLPSVEKMSKMTASHTNMVIRDCHDIGIDYARTLKHWHETFVNNTDSLAAAGYDEWFRRMWEFYFCYCEGGFRERTISTVQLQLSKPEFYGTIVR